MSEEELRSANVFIHKVFAGVLCEDRSSGACWFEYCENYIGPPLSLAMPTAKRSYRFPSFPPFFDGLLPEGMMLESMLRANKLDRQDRFGQLIVVGSDLVGAVEVRSAE